MLGGRLWAAGHRWGEVDRGGTNSPTGGRRGAGGKFFGGKFSGPNFFLLLRAENRGKPLPGSTNLARPPLGASRGLHDTNT